MGRKNKPMTYQCEQALKSCLAIGESKHEDKKTGATADKIYSWSTFKTYLKHSIYFAQWCKEQYGCRTLADCRQYTDNWLQHQQDRGMSAYTVKMERAALCKLYHTSHKEIGASIVINRRTYDNITRSRGDAVRDKNFSAERNADLITMAVCTGLRRSEMAALRGNCLIQTDNGWRIDVHSASKGGRHRLAPVVGAPDEIARVVQIMQSAGDGKVFPRIHSAFDEHSYRRQYAQRVYDASARPLSVCKADATYRRHKHDKYDRDAVYWRRGAHKGEWLDKRALECVTQALGHNRISVAAEHYLK